MQQLQLHHTPKWNSSVCVVVRLENVILNCYVYGDRKRNGDGIYWYSDNSPLGVKDQYPGQILLLSVIKAARPGFPPLTSVVLQRFGPWT